MGVKISAIVFTAAFDAAAVVITAFTLSRPQPEACYSKSRILFLLAHFISFGSFHFFLVQIFSFRLKMILFDFGHFERKNMRRKRKILHPKEKMCTLFNA